MLHVTRKDEDKYVLATWIIQEQKFVHLINFFIFYQLWRTDMINTGHARVFLFDGGEKC
jgi:hypothetical protein